MLPPQKFTTLNGGTKAPPYEKQKALHAQGFCIVLHQICTNQPGHLTLIFKKCELHYSKHQLEGNKSVTGIVGEVDCIQVNNFTIGQSNLISHLFLSHFARSTC